MSESPEGWACVCTDGGPCKEFPCKSYRASPPEKPALADEEALECPACGKIHGDYDCQARHPVGYADEIRALTVELIEEYALVPDYTEALDFLADRAEALVTAVRKWRRYAKHDIPCRSNDVHGYGYTDEDCTCGLTDWREKVRLAEERESDLAALAALDTAQGE